MMLNGIQFYLVVKFPFFLIRMIKESFRNYWFTFFSSSIFLFDIMWYRIGSLWSKTNSSYFYGKIKSSNHHILLSPSLQIGISLSYGIWCISFNLTVFMFARILSGLSKANVAIILAIVSDTTTEQQRNRAMVRKENILI